MNRREFAGMAAAIAALRLKLPLAVLSPPPLLDPEPVTYQGEVVSVMPEVLATSPDVYDLPLEGLVDAWITEYRDVEPWCSENWDYGAIPRPESATLELKFLYADGRDARVPGYLVRVDLREYLPTYPVVIVGQLVSVVHEAFSGASRVNMTIEATEAPVWG